MYDDENHCANGPELRFEVKLTEYNTQSMARSVAQMISEIVMREEAWAV